MPREYKTMSMKDNPSGPTPRYTYTSPAIKTQPGLPPELGYHIEEYKLPAIDVQTARRNFPGYTEAQVYTLDEIRGGDTWGTTETDSDTHPQGSGGYTKINTKMRKMR